MKLNLRKRTILENLIKKNLSLTALAEILMVSSRTIRRDLILIHAILADYGYALEKVGDQYQIIGDKKRLHELLLANKRLELNDCERQIYILSNLIKKPITTRQLALDLFLPEKQIRQDCDKINALFSQNVITIKKNHMQITDNEQIIRLVIATLLIELLQTMDLEAVAETLDIELVNFENLKNEIDRLICLTDFKRVALIVESVFTHHQKYLSDLELLAITIKLLVVLKRIEYHQPLAHKYVANATNSVIATNIVNKLKVADVNEQIFLINMISNYTLEIEIKDLDLAQTKKIKNFLNIINQHLNIDYINQNELHINVYNHILRNQQQKTEDLKIEDFPFVQLCADYQFLFSIIKKANKIAATNFREIELAEILIYYVLQLEKDIVKIRWNILVVCMGGMGTSLMIKNQIMQILYHAKVDNMALSSASRCDLGQYDLVVSTSSFADKLGAIMISPMLTNTDIRNINKYLVFKRLNKNVIVNQSTHQVGFLAYYQDEFSINDKRLVLKNVLNKLQRQHLINNVDYLLEKILIREKNGVGVPGSKIAMYHTTSSSIIKPSIYLINMLPFEVAGIDLKKQMCSSILLVLVPSVFNDQIRQQINFLSHLLITNDDVCRYIELGDVVSLQKLLVVGE